jgi:hypothetical protein
MPTYAELTPKKRAALADCASGQLLRCKDGYRAREGASVHSKRVCNQLAADCLVIVSEFERTVDVTPLGLEVAGVAGLANAA